MSGTQSQEGGRPSDEASADENLHDSAGGTPEESASQEAETVEEPDFYSIFNSEEDGGEEREAEDDTDSTPTDTSETDDADDGEKPSEDEDETDEDEESEDSEGDEGELEFEDDLEDPEKGDLDFIPNKEWSSLPEATRKRIESARESQKALRRDLKEAQPFVEHGKAIVDFTKANNIGEEDLRVGLDLIAKFNKGGEEAVQAALEVAQHFGYEPANTAAADGDLPKWLQDQVDDLSMTEEAARTVLTQMGGGSQAQPAAQKADAQLQQETAEGRKQLDERITSLQEKYPSSKDKLLPRIEREAYRLRDTHPEVWDSPLKWGALYDLATDNVLAKAKPTKRKAPDSKGLGSGGGKKRKASQSEGNENDRFYKIFR